VSVPATLFGTPVKLLDRSAVAVQDLILANTELATWCQGRVYREEAPRVPDAAHLWPAIYVNLGREEVERSSVGVQCLDLVWSIVVSFVTKSDADRLLPKEPSTSSIFAHVRALLFLNKELRVPRYSDEFQATSFEGFEPTDYFERGDVAGKTFLMRSLIANYRYAEVDPVTLEP
jgi:hypothetical protein